MSFRRRAPEELTQNLAASLCYLTFLPAVVFLFTPPYSENRFVRFHAFQSILFSLVFFTAEFMLNFLTLTAPFFVNLFLPISSAFFIVWILCMIKAYQNKEFRLPILGDIAASQAVKP